MHAFTERYHVDLVRSPEHPKKEGEYVIQCCVSSYKLWSREAKLKAVLAWEWHLKHIRRIHFHRTVDKLEVEAGRYGLETFMHRFIVKLLS